MELQRKRSFNTKQIIHDFRKEYKGSFLEKKFDAPKSGIRSLAEWIYTKASKKNLQKTETTEDSSHFDKTPNEILFQILKNCTDHQTVLACRRVSRRFKACTDKVSKTDVNVLSRFVITGLGKKGIEMRWINYQDQKSKSTVVSWQSIKKRDNFVFNFNQFAIQRIIFKNLSLNDELVDFLRFQLQNSDTSKLLQLSLNHVDFSSANSLTLHRLLAPISKTLEIFEIIHGTGMKRDSVTDEHLAQLDAGTIRRISIDGVKFSGSVRSLNIGDGALKKLAESGAFPSLILDRCAVTTEMVCYYTTKWFEQCNESEKQLRSQVCTVKRCPKMKGSLFEAECKKRGLQCKNRRGSGTITLYNVQEEKTKREFTIALASLDDKERQKIEDDRMQNIVAPA